MTVSQEITKMLDELGEFCRKEKVKVELHAIFKHSNHTQGFDWR